MKPGGMQRRGIQKPESRDRILRGFLASRLSMSWRAGARPRWQGPPQHSEKGLRLPFVALSVSSGKTCQRKIPCAHTQGYESHQLRSGIFDGLRWKRAGGWKAADRRLMLSDDRRELAVLPGFNWLTAPRSAHPARGWATASKARAAPS